MESVVNRRAFVVLARLFCLSAFIAVIMTGAFSVAVFPVSVFADPVG